MQQGFAQVQDDCYEAKEQMCFCRRKEHEPKKKWNGSWTIRLIQTWPCCRTSAELFDPSISINSQGSKTRMSLEGQRKGNVKVVNEPLHLVNKADGAGIFHGVAVNYHRAAVKKKKNQWNKTARVLFSILQSKTRRSVMWMCMCESENDNWHLP